MRLKSFDVEKMLLETGVLWHVSQTLSNAVPEQSPLDSELSHVGSTPSGRVADSRKPGHQEIGV
jgi:hypothetical protein